MSVKLMEDCLNVEVFFLTRFLHVRNNLAECTLSGYMISNV